ncbi:hypothetical protein QFC20_003186 [Naganishia adeliensis]|uniref:Uncharacterized protein n=1 Tax=Naganishia adeliensis TaxID=92952 RepID=A0ACC2WEZ2_9TREE|nr:hypothetical protein QFC20_003186 [Naganishia adeliensis]
MALSRAQDVKVDNTTGSASGNGDKSEGKTISAKNAASETPSNDDVTAQENPPKNNAEGGTPAIPTTSETEVPEFKPQSPPRGGANSGPHYVIYTDSENSLTKEKGKMLPSVADLKGFNRLLLAFWMTDRKLPARPELTGKGPVDRAEYWSGLSSTDRKRLKAEYNKAGTSVMVSAFGEAGRLMAYLSPEMLCSFLTPVVRVRRSVAYETLKWASLEYYAIAIE